MFLDLLRYMNILFAICCCYHALRVSILCTLYEIWPETINIFKLDNPNLVLRTEGCNACYICFCIDRNFEILILWNTGRDCRVTTATVSSSNWLEPGSDLTRALYFEECMTCRLYSIKLSATQ